MEINLFFRILEESILITGKMVSDQVHISEKNMIQDLIQKGYGDFEKEKLVLQNFETLYLLYLKRLLVNKNKTKIDFDHFMKLCKKKDSKILTKFLIYRDLRTRGYVAKDGFGFGSDFRVYERGHFGEKGAKFLIFGFNEGQQEKMGSLYKKIDDITQMGKEPIIAVIERRGEIIYYKINKINFNENKSMSEVLF